MTTQVFHRIKALIQVALLIFIFLLQGSLFAAEAPKKVALLFLTRNGLHYPAFWKTMLAYHADKFNFYIYSDYPLTDPFFEAARIKQLIPTKWDYHAKTWQLILTRACKNPENKKFVYLSESCLPIMPLEDIYEALIADDNSYMCYAGPWWPKDNCREVVELPVEHRWGNHEWIILNRKHARMIVNDREIIDIVSKHWIDVESYPSSLFSVKGCLGEFNNRPTTFVNWALAEGGGAHPYHFREDSLFNRNMLLEAKKGNHFFARKVVPLFPEQAIWQIMYQPVD